MAEPKAIVVVTGAGASKGCADESLTVVVPGYRPPLTKDLFTPTPSFNEILRKYPGAQTFADEFRTQVRAGLNLENLLREAYYSEHENTRRRALEIPYYLSELFLAVSSKFTDAAATKYATLVRHLDESGFEKVLFLTTNYDLLLDGALSAYHSFEFGKIDDYVRGDRRWNLVKIHGSANWFRPIANFDPPSANLSASLGRVASPLELEDESRIMYENAERSYINRQHLMFPAVTVPLVGKYKYMCPTEHIEYAKTFVSVCDTFLFIVNSCVDDTLLDLLGKARQPVHIKVVNGKAVGGTGVMTPGDEALVRIPFDNFRRYNQDQPVFNGEFVDFMNSPNSTDFLRDPFGS
ncbi:MAG: hypothetical protein IH851_02935 [Armatimonadetes bacterium]|nr:hypothetical protein [Armatimonadota bacterium]